MLNIADIIVILVLALLVGFAIKSMISRSKDSSSCSMCQGDCAHCSRVHKEKYSHPKL